MPDKKQPIKLNIKDLNGPKIDPAIIDNKDAGIINTIGLRPYNSIKANAEYLP